MLQTKSPRKSIKLLVGKGDNVIVFFMRNVSYVDCRPFLPKIFSLTDKMYIYYYHILFFFNEASEDILCTLSFLNLFPIALQTLLNFLTQKFISSVGNYRSATIFHTHSFSCYVKILNLRLIERVGAYPIP